MECAVRIKAMSISCAHACAFYLCVPVRSQPTTQPTLRPFLSAQKETFLEMLRSRIHGLGCWGEPALSARSVPGAQDGSDLCSRSVGGSSGRRREGIGRERRAALLRSRSPTHPHKTRVFVPPEPMELSVTKVRAFSRASESPTAYVLPDTTARCVAKHDDAHTHTATRDT